MRTALQLGLLTLGAAVAAYGAATLSPIQEDLRQALSLTDNHMALLQGLAVAAPMTFVSVPLGLLIDRWKRVRLLFLFVVLTTAGAILTAVAHTFEMLFLSRAMIGIGVPATGIIAVTLVGDLYPPAARGTATMIVNLGQVVGRSAAFALGGFLVTHAPGGGGGGGEAWRWAAALLTIPLGVAAVLVLLMREPERREVGRPDRPPLHALAELWRLRALVGPILAGLTLVMFADTAVLVWAVPSFTRAFGADAAQVGAAIATALLVSGVAGPLLGGPLADAATRSGGPRRIMSLLALLTFTTAPAGLFALAPTFAYASVLLTVFLLAGAAMGLICTTLTLVVVPNELRGLAMMVMNGLGLPVTYGLAPLSVSLLSDAFGGPSSLPVALSLVALTISLAGGAVFVLGRRFFAGREAPDERT